MDPPGKAAATVMRSPVKGTTLLDVYEVEWITRELERLLVSGSGCGGGGGGGGRRAGDGRRRLSGTKQVVGSYTKPAAGDRKGGVLTELLGRHAVSICGDTAAAVASGRARRGPGSLREVEKV